MIGCILECIKSNPKDNINFIVFYSGALGMRPLKRRNLRGPILVKINLPKTYIPNCKNRSRCMLCYVINIVLCLTSSLVNTLYFLLYSLYFTDLTSFSILPAFLLGNNVKLFLFFFLLFKI